MRPPHEDTSLPRVVRNILARHHHEVNGPASSYEDQGQRDRLNLELQIANAMEQNCPFWGQALPYDGRRGSGIASFVKPRTMRYSATYNLELAQDMAAMYGNNADAKRELVFAMSLELIAEIEQLINGRDLLFYPCIPARPMAVVDPTTFQPTYKFDTIFYLAKPESTILREWSFDDVPVPVTEPSRKFMNKYYMHLSDPTWGVVGR